MRTPNYICVVCGADMYARPKDISKTQHGLTCSKECGIKNRSNWMMLQGNHQYGLKGNKNSSFTGEIKISRYGYVLMYMPDHTRANHAGYVFEHILVMENSIDRPLKYYGHKSKYNEVCHHIDRDKTNNRLENLQLMTELEHFELHKKEDEYAKKAGIRRSKLSKDDVLLIKEMHKSGISQHKISKHFNVGQTLIGNAINGRRKCYESM